MGGGETFSCVCAVLFCGDVRGELGAVAARVNALQTSASGPFEAVFAVGSFFGDAAAGGGFLGASRLRANVVALPQRARLHMCVWH